MKIFVIVNNYPQSTLPSHQGWYLLADSAMTNTGKPFFIPENIGTVNAYLGIAIKISRLGKHIETKFAHRYYSEWAPVVHFVFKTVEERLGNDHLPLDASRSFDRSLFVGDFKPLEELDDIALYKDGELKQIFSMSKILSNPDEVIRNVSDINTLKIGDIIVPALTEPTEVIIGNFLEVKKGDERLFHVKMK
ncbi:MAG: hypothetical protein J1E16_09875 [Muribaculaceae bacterium]|nr:hypothetical protein [Muribaculaceae bacterium]